MLSPYIVILFRLSGDGKFGSSSSDDGRGDERWPKDGQVDEERGQKGGNRIRAKSGISSYLHLRLATFTSLISFTIFWSLLNTCQIPPGWLHRHWLICWSSYPGNPNTRARRGTGKCLKERKARTWKHTFSNFRYFCLFPSQNIFTKLYMSADHSCFPWVQFNCKTKYRTSLESDNKLFQATHRCKTILSYLHNHKCPVLDSWTWNRLVIVSFPFVLLVWLFLFLS